jgi:hypothetical protein
MLTAYSDPAVLESSCNPNYSAADLLDGSAKTLYLYAPEGEQDRLRTLFSTVVMELISLVQASAATSKHPLDPPLLLALDEAANVAPIPNLAQVASTGRRSRTPAALDLPGRQPTHQRPWQRSADGLQQPQGEGHRRRYERPGDDQPDPRHNQQSETSGEGRASATTSTTYRDLAPANVIRELRPGEAMFLNAHLPRCDFTYGLTMQANSGVEADGPARNSWEKDTVAVGRPAHNGNAKCARADVEKPAPVILRPKRLLILCSLGVVGGLALLGGSLQPGPPPQREAIKRSAERRIVPAPPPQHVEEEVRDHSKKTAMHLHATADTPPSPPPALEPSPPPPSESAQAPKLIYQPQPDQTATAQPPASTRPPTSPSVEFGM